jgi:hypothetical protein
VWFLEFLDRLIQRRECLRRFVAIHERLEECPRGGRRWNRGPTGFLLEEAQSLGHLVGGPRGPEVRFGELILAVIERTCEPVHLGRVFEAPVFPPLCSQ